MLWEWLPRSCGTSLPTFFPCYILPLTPFCSSSFVLLLQGTPPPSGTLLKYAAFQNKTSAKVFNLYWNQWAVLDAIDVNSQGDSQLGVRLGNYKQYIAGQGGKQSGYWVS